MKMRTLEKTVSGDNGALNSRQYSAIITYRVKRRKLITEPANQPPLTYIGYSLVH